MGENSAGNDSSFPYGGGHTISCSCPASPLNQNTLVPGLTTAISGTND